MDERLFDTWGDFIASQARTLHARLPRGHPASPEDLAQAGYIGLLKADANPPHSTSFEQAANFRIRHEMADEIRRMGIPRAVYRVQRMRYARFLSLEQLLAMDRGRELFTDHGSQARRAEARALALRAMWDMTRLDRRAAETVRLHYLEGVPNREIAVRWGLHETRISQLQRSGIEKLRAHWGISV